MTVESLEEQISKAKTLIEALPYIQSFRGKIVVVKYGGSTMNGSEDTDTVLSDVVFMEIVGMKPVVVHGGGPAISRRLETMGVESARINGLRVTDKRTMRVVEDVLCGEVNAAIVDSIKRLGGASVGVSAGESGIMQVRKHLAQTPEGPVDIGFVGDVDRIDPAPLTDLLDAGSIPVVAPIGRDPEGQSYNVNADLAAAEIAAALHAEKLVFLTDVKGILQDAADEDSLLSTVRLRDVDALIATGVVAGGMIPKVSAGVKSVTGGVRKTHIIDGRIPHAMLLEFFTHEGIGTQIVR